MKRLSWITLLMLAMTVSCLAAEESGGAAEPGIGWKWANFAILAVGLGYLMAKALPPLFRSRTTEIQKGIAEAKAMKQDADRRAAEVEAKTRQLGADIERFRAESKAEMQQEGERIRLETAEQIRRMEQKAAEEIESAGKIARRELKQYAAQLAMELAEQRVRARVDQNTEQVLVDGFLSDLRKESRN